MAFLSKDVLLSEAARLGVELEGLTWPEQQSAVRAAMNGEPSQEDELSKAKAEIARLNAIINSSNADDVTKGKEVSDDGSYDPVDYGIIIAPEIAPTNIQLIKYDEELGNDIDVEEVYFDVSEHARIASAKDMSTGTYRIKGEKNRKVIAQSTIPKQNAGVRYYDLRDWLVEIRDPSTGRVGYPWTHQSFQGFKDLLRQSGYYFKYKHMFNAKEHPENIWYAAGKMLVCDIDVCHNIMAEIEREEEKKQRLGWE